MKPSFAIQWHITDECDQRCKHCYIFAEGGCTELASMPLGQVERVFLQCREMCESLDRELYFYLTGGDPLLHPDFWRIAELMRDAGVRWAVMGNPFHLNPEVCTQLKELGCRKYQLSLDGLERTHDEFRMSGSFARTLEAIDTLNAAGIWTAVMTTVSSANRGDIPDLIDLLAGRVSVYAFGRYCPTSGQRRDEFHIEPLEYRDFLLRCQERILRHETVGCTTTFQRKDHLWTLLEWEQGLFEIPADADPELIYDGCHCATGHMTITPTGDVYGCRRMESLVGNVTHEHPREIFLGDAMEALRDFNRFEKCATCELLGWCRGCPAVAAGYTGSMYSPDPQCWKAEVPSA